ncbi:MAG: hypothetical protein IH991_03040 [Planctomycetes bacterium]|nr:hypothetical protein [Planctomycetota bacterium]
MWWTTRLGFRLPGLVGGPWLFPKCPEYISRIWVLVTPIWLLVVAVGFPTAFLWWRDRRPKAGFCKVCKYDLTCNVSGTCPECGTAIEDATKTNRTTKPTAGA